MSANASSSITGTAARAAAGDELSSPADFWTTGLNLSGRPGIESLSATGEAHIFFTCSSTCRFRADLLLAVREGTMGGYAGSLAAASVWTSRWCLNRGRLLGNSKGSRVRAAMFPPPLLLLPFRQKETS
uniref:Uncharacterized protein n=1 Tax=Echeneis naucrates TaxID=173247 RepID=A0A665WZ31_ECHNA